MIAAQIERKTGKISEEIWNFFVRGPQATANASQNKLKWLTEKQWINLNSLSQIQEFSGLVKSFEKRSDEWKKFMMCANPTKRGRNLNS